MRPGRRALLAASAILASCLTALAAAPSPVVAWQIAPGTSGLLVEDHRVGVVSLRIEFPAGLYSPWVLEHHADEAFEAQLHDSEGSLRKRADELAVDLALSVDERSSQLRLSCRTGDLEAALGLVRDVLRNRDFDRGDLVRAGREEKLGFEASQKEPEFVRKQASARLLYREEDPRRGPTEKT
jgi:predicted Zn-dependent peptidase